MAWPRSPPQAVVATTAVAVPLPPVASVSSQFFGLCCCVAFKQRMNLGAKEGRSHS